jgi:hypothetical protein
MPTFAFVAAPPRVTPQLQRHYNAPLPLFRIHSFGTELMPEYFPRRNARLVSCYALFK